MIAGRPMPREDWRDLPVYRPLQSPVAIDVSDNTSRFGAPPSALAALRRADDADATRYPSAYGEALKHALAAYAGVSPGAIVTGCGSDDVLDSAIRAFARPGERLVTLAPSFPMAATFARLNALEVTSVPLAPDGTFDPDAVTEARAAITYVCSPNNPTGAPLDPDAITRVIEHTRGVVLLDEAYTEFCGVTRVAEAPARANLVVTRTLSKAFGLAGLRVGWASACADLVRPLELSRGPYKVGASAERAATAALTHDVAWMRARAAQAVAAREALALALRSLGLSPLRSAANFVLVPLSGAAHIAAAMRTAGVAVRAFEALPGIGDALRITAAPEHEQARVLATLAEALACA